MKGCHRIAPDRPQINSNDGALLSFTSYRCLSRCLTRRICLGAFQRKLFARLMALTNDITDFHAPEIASATQPGHAGMGWPEPMPGPEQTLVEKGLKINILSAVAYKTHKNQLKSVSTDKSFINAADWKTISYQIRRFLVFFECVSPDYIHLNFKCDTSYFQWNSMFDSSPKESLNMVLYVRGKKNANPSYTQHCNHNINLRFQNIYTDFTKICEFMIDCHHLDSWSF